MARIWPSLKSSKNLCLRGRGKNNPIINSVKWLISLEISYWAERIRFSTVKIAFFQNPLHEFLVPLKQIAHDQISSDL